MPELLILKDGLTAFHRSYSENPLENFDMTAGFLQAILQFSNLEVRDNLEALRLSNSAFYFHSRREFNFVLREDRSADSVHKVAPLTLSNLATRFFEQFPEAPQWDGNLSAFDKFSSMCDQLLQARPERKGIPILFRTTGESVFFAPILDITPIAPENEEKVYDLQSQLQIIIKTNGINAFWTRLREPLLIRLPATKSIAYIFQVQDDAVPSVIKYLLCCVLNERDFDSFYQLSSLIRRKFKQTNSYISQFIDIHERDPLSPIVKNNMILVQDTLQEWADLNQYIGGVRASFFEAFLKAQVSCENLTENRIRQQLEEVLNKIGDDFDKIVFSLLTLRPIMFVSNEKSVVEPTLSALLAFYPHPSVELWCERPSDALLIGAPPSLASQASNNPLVVDLDHCEVRGGIKNEFCSDITKDTFQVAINASVSEARIYFQGKITSVFLLLNSLLDLMPVEKGARQVALQQFQETIDPAVIQLLTRMARNLNIPLEVSW